MVVVEGNTEPGQIVDCWCEAVGVSTLRNKLGKVIHFFNSGFN